MEITVNGDRQRIDVGATVADLLVGARCDGIAVARNGVVVPRTQHATTVLGEGDVIEIVEAVQGG